MAESCVTDITEFQAQFLAVFEGPFASGSTSAELFQRFFPGQSDFIFENCEQLAYSITGITVLGISQNINGAADTAFPQSFVLTFADLATQEPIGELSTFDPVTGTGSVVTPDLPPGPAPVAAICISPTLDIDALETGIRETGDFLRSIRLTDEICYPNIPEFAAFVEEFLGRDADLFEFLEAIGPDRHPEHRGIRCVGRADLHRARPAADQGRLQEGRLGEFPRPRIQESGSMHQVREHGPVAHDHDHYHHSHHQHDDDHDGVAQRRVPQLID